MHLLEFHQGRVICNPVVPLGGWCNFGNKQRNNTPSISNINICRIFYCCLTESLESTGIDHSSPITFIMYSTRMLALAAAIAASAVALAPLHEHLGSSARIVPGKFIVKMKDDVSQAASNEVESLMGSVDYVYNVTPFKAFTGRLSLAALDSLREHPGVCSLMICLIGPVSNFGQC